MIVLRWLRVQWDRVLAVTVLVAGILALSIGWAGISDEVFAARQLPYLLSGGIGGLFLLGIGATLWLSADLRDDWHQLRRIEQRMAAAAESRAGGAEIPGNSHRRASPDYTPAQASVGSGQFQS